MNQKERLNNTLKFKNPERVPFFEIALWEQTVDLWKEQGLPEEGADADLFTGNEYFGLEGYDLVLFNLTFPEPCPEEKKISEDDRYIRFIDGMGRTRVALKEGTIRSMRASMDNYVDFPVKNKKDFQRIRKGYEKNHSRRLPDNWPRVVKDLENSTRPSTFLDRYFASFGYYSMLRNWMGTEGLSYMFYDDPKLVHECLEFLTDFITGWMKKPLKEASFDLYYIHEDMAGKSGPLVSPKLFREFFSPHYKKFVDFLKNNGVQNIIVDTDGNFEVLIPDFLNTGVEGFGPIERAAGLDPVKLRKKYGKSFFMIGGIDKRELAKGRKEIDKEIEYIIPPMLDSGGFIPTVDHSVPPDVPMDNFKYYLEQKWEMIDGGK